jgi:uncharacterized radical SAM superfamily Fe-S cluster-containing enzyme
MQEAINELWSGQAAARGTGLADAREEPHRRGGISDEDAERVLAILKRLLKELFPRGGALPRAAAQRIAERATTAIYLHSHMDEETFDSERIAQCCVGVPAPDGSNIPTCSYNVLYRERDPRFNAHAPPWHERAGGRRDFSDAP